MVVGVVEVERCPTCRGVWGTRPALEALVGAKVVSRASEVSIAGLGAEEAARCPRCGAGMQREATPDAPGQELLACGACGGLWADDEAVLALRATRARRASVRPRADASPAGPGARDPEVLDDGSPFAPGPARELALLAVLLGVAWAAALARVGEALAFLARMQFHELGHALLAWSTGRRALPLPFGFTPWSLERSSLLVLMEVVFVVLLATHGVRERRPAPFLVALALGAVLGIGLSTPLEASEPWVIAGGHVGEALLPGLGLLAFHARLPARVRWDFWRWPLALVAAFALAFVVSEDREIAQGVRELPSGAFLSGDAATGDLERLVLEHGFSPQELRQLFGRLAAVAFALGVLSHPIVLLPRWVKERRAQRP